MSTYTPKAGDIQRSWHVVDADGLVLGRLASEVAKILRGKHKPIFTPHQDTGDHVVIVNAAKVVLTGAKGTDKAVYRHSGYPGGLRTRPYGKLLLDRPEEALRRTIGGMLPRNRLGRRMLSKLKVYRGPEHPHQAQCPQPLVLDHTRAHGPRLSEDTAEPDTATSDPAPGESGSISELGLSARLESSIRGAGVATVDDLVARSASEVAKILRGKHKPIFTPHQDTGDHVVIVNAAKVVLTGAKATDKAVYRHSGYPGGLRTRPYGRLLLDRPEEALRRTKIGRAHV